jgi:hypothetical protein
LQSSEGDGIIPPKSAERGGKVATSSVTTGSKVRELFIEELAQVQGGAPSSEPGYTTMACCEEGPFGCCDLIDLDDIIRP